MSKTKWSKVKRGQSVELGGRTWLVEKIKPKGKRGMKVAVRSGARAAQSVVDADEKVRVVEAPPVKGDAKRPAKQAAHKPPKPAHGDPWETQQDRIEKKLDKILGARLMGEATDVDAGYYVPPCDETNVAAHLAIFHGGIPEELREKSEAVMLGEHARAHLAALEHGERFAVHHWHTEKRPTTATKKGKK